LNAYVDSSFIISAYIPDAHSNRAEERLALGFSVWMTPFNSVEVESTIFQQVFFKGLSFLEAQRTAADFQRDILSGIWSPIEFPINAWSICVILARQYGPTIGVRTLDSLHVACALELKADKFWTFDDRQARLAEAVGLDISP
jgi:predicted nucleic acid-binding protein